MPTIRIFRLIIIFALISNASFALAYDFNDTFEAAFKIDGKYFMIYYTRGLDVESLARRLNIGAEDRLMAGEPPQEVDFSDRGFAEMVDTLFLRVCKILDIQLYNFNGTLKICRDQTHLNSVYNSLFNKQLNTSSFYITDINTIYISAENFKKEILAHEMAHAVIGYYFVVQPPIKTSEILAGYVEYQLRKPPKN